MQWDDLRSAAWSFIRNRLFFKENVLLLVRVVGQICFVRIKSNFSHAGRGKLLLYIVLKKKKKKEKKT